MPKSRYGIMTPYMDKVGTLGTSMMYRSATVQANLDFSDEADMIKKLRVSLALQPIVTALFANSPFVDGKPSGYLSFRSHIWLNTDNARTGMLPFVFDEGFGFDRYAEHALDVPMYFVIRNKQYINVAGESFRAFMRGELPQLPGEKPTIVDWENHLSTLFPEVRLKQFLEMRGADMGDEAHVNALPALWVGLLYDHAALDEAWSQIRNWTVEEMWKLRNDVPMHAIHTPFRGCKVSDVARAVLDVARQGLMHRGFGEEKYLAPLEETLALNKTPAERWLDKYNGEWGGDVMRVFDEAEI
jgi:glutamate--cysteine ligase